MFSACATRWPVHWICDEAMRLMRPLCAEDVLLRPLDRADASGPYLAWFGDAHVMRFLVPIDGPMTVERLEDYIGDNERADNALLAGIFLDSGERHVGNIRLSGIERAFSRASVGIVIGARAEWGKGIAARAIRALTGFAHAELGLRYLYAGCHEGNIGSINAFRKAGYFDLAHARAHIRSNAALRDGIRIDHVMMVHCDA